MGAALPTPITTPGAPTPTDQYTSLRACAEPAPAIKTNAKPADATAANQERRWVMKILLGR